MISTFSCDMGGLVDDDCGFGGRDRLGSATASGGDRLLAGEPVCDVDGNDREQDDDHGDDVGDRQLLAAEEVVEDPDRQGLLATAEGERGDDDLVEREREGE